ncbi:MAG: tetratricopeptide repeat protein, partial [bacterium]
KGLVGIRTEKYHESIEHFNKAIDIDQKYLDAYYYRGIARIGIGDKKNGCMDLLKANELGKGKNIGYKASKKMKDCCK